jgi:hypothetical protein
MQAMPGGDLNIGMRLASMSGISLADLASMDDLTVADILGGLTVRGRCGIGAKERYVAQQGGIAERCA